MNEYSWIPLCHDPEELCALAQMAFPLSEMDIIWFILYKLTLLSRIGSYPRGVISWEPSLPVGLRSGHSTCFPSWLWCCSGGRAVGQAAGSCRLLNPQEGAQGSEGQCRECSALPWLWQTSHHWESCSQQFHHFRSTQSWVKRGFFFSWLAVKWSKCSTLQLSLKRFSCALPVNGRRGLMGIQRLGKTNMQNKAYRTEIWTRNAALVFL